MVRIFSIFLASIFPASILIALITMASISGKAFARPYLDGTGDSGGGNLYKGKPLESYIVKPVSLQSYRIFIRPMREGFTGTMVESTLRGVLENKTWYFVPGPLKSLPDGAIGSAVPTNQVALQDFNSVWIDSDLFGAMTLEDQAKILMHEMLMGAKLLRLDSYWHSCWVRSFGYQEYEGCEEASKSARGRPSDLTHEDYTQIRRTTAEIFSSRQNRVGQDWEELLGKAEFDDPPAIVFKVRDEMREISLQSLKRWLLESKLLGYEVSRGFETSQILIQNPHLLNVRPGESLFWRSHESCSAEIAIDGRDLTFHLRMGEKEVSFTQRAWFETFSMQRKDRYGEMVWEGSFLNSPTAGAKPGDEFYVVDLAFSAESRLDSIEVQRGICLTDGCSTGRNPKEGLNYICSVRDVFKYF